MRRALKILIRRIDAANDAIGRGTAWLTLALVLVCCAVAVLRYALSVGAIWLQELYVWFHALVFVIGAGYTLKEGGHVRVDLIYGRFGPRGRALVEIIGSLLFLLPWLALVGWLSLKDALGSLFPPNQTLVTADLLRFIGWLALLLAAGAAGVFGLGRAARAARMPQKIMITAGAITAAAALGWFAAGEWGAVAHRVGEASAQMGGMPAIWLLKLALPAMVLLLGLQALALNARAILVLLGDETAAPQGGGHG